MENMFTNYQRKVVSRLATIDLVEADACMGCGGEDCRCCEIALDRSVWISPELLFADGGICNEF